MKKISILAVPCFLVVLFIVGCMGGGYSPPDDPYHPPDFQQVRQGFFVSGIMVYAEGEVFNQLYPDLLVRIKTTSRYAGYLRILDVGEELVLKAVLYDDQGSVFSEERISLWPGESYDLDQDGKMDLLWSDAGVEIHARGLKSAPFYLEFLSHREEGMCQYETTDIRSDSGILKWFARPVNKSAQSQVRWNKLVEASQFQLIEYDLDAGYVIFQKDAALVLDVGDVINKSALGLFREIIHVEEGASAITVYYDALYPDLSMLFENISMIIDAPAEAYLERSAGRGLSFDELWNQIGETDFAEGVGKNRLAFTYEEMQTIIHTSHTSLVLFPRFKIDTQILWIYEQSFWDPHPTRVDRWEFGFEGAFLAELVAAMSLRLPYNPQPNPSISINLPAAHPLAWAITIGARFELGARIDIEAKGWAEIGYRTWCERFRWYAKAHSRGSMAGGVMGFDVVSDEDPNTNQFRFERIGPDYGLEGNAKIQPYLQIAPYLILLSGFAEAGVGLEGLVDIQAKGVYSSNQETEVEVSVDVGLDWIWNAQLFWTGFGWTDWKGTGALFRYRVMDFSMKWPWAPYNLRSENLKASVYRSSGLRLDWDSDSLVTEGYEIQRDGVSIGESQDLFYIDPQAVSGQEYTYQARAFTQVEFTLFQEQVYEQPWLTYSPWTDPISGVFFPSATLSLQASPTKGGWLSGEGTYVKDDVVRVEAMANEGYRFSEWLLDADTVGTEAAFDFIMPGTDTHLIACFIPCDDPPPLEYAIEFAQVYVRTMNFRDFVQLSFEVFILESIEQDLIRLYAEGTHIGQIDLPPSDLVQQIAGAVSFLGWASLPQGVAPELGDEYLITAEFPGEDVFSTVIVKSEKKEVFPTILEPEEGALLNPADPIEVRFKNIADAALEYYSVGMWCRIDGEWSDTRFYRFLGPAETELTIPSGLICADTEEVYIDVTAFFEGAAATYRRYW